MRSICSRNAKKIIWSCQWRSPLRYRNFSVRHPLRHPLNAEQSDNQDQFEVVWPIFREGKIVSDLFTSDFLPFNHHSTSRAAKIIRRLLLHQCGSQLNIMRERVGFHEGGLRITTDPPTRNALDGETRLSDIYRGKVTVMIYYANTHQFSSTPTLEKFGGKLADAIDGRGWRPLVSRRFWILFTALARHWNTKRKKNKRLKPCTLWEPKSKGYQNED